MNRLTRALPGSLGSILTAKRRSFVTMLGAAWGVMILVGEFTIIVGLEKENTRYIEEEGGMTFISLETSGDRGLSLDEVASIASNSTADFIVSPEVTVPCRDGVYLLVVSPNFPHVSSFGVERGRFISSVDLRQRNRVCVLGTEAEEILFHGHSALGREIQLQDVRYTVVGVMEHESEERDMITGRRLGIWKGMRKNALVFIPFTTAKTRHPRISSQIRMDFRTETLTQVTDAIEEILIMLEDMDRTPEEFDLRSRSDEMEWIYSMVRRFKYGLYAMILLCLLMAGVGVANLMLVQVNERIREIGVRKAMGASNLDIFVHFLAEATTLSVLGGGMGILLGIGIAKVVSALTGLPYGFSPGVTTVGVIASICLGIASGAAPAVKASHLNPVEALRYE